jgi:protein disulfide-isomerase-like protein
MIIRWLSLLLLLALCTKEVFSKVVGVQDANEYKKLLKSRTNVLIAFAGAKKDLPKGLLDKFETVSSQVTGQATLAYFECSADRQTKQICKKLGIENGVAIKHFNKGTFNKDYDRPHEVRSIVNFLKDPTGDIPWEEDPTATAVAHLDESNFDSTIAKGKKTLVMFYAPWCGHCKKIKPEYAEAAQELESGKKNSPYIMAAIDATKASAIGSKYEIEGYPTLKYFEKGKLKYTAQARTKQELIDYMKEPAAPAPPPPPEPAWQDQPGDVLHLNDETFDNAISQNPSVLVMFYAPWCGHCKHAKPEYSSAATKLKEEGYEGKLAAVDATIAPILSKKYEVKGFPTLLYFKDGEKAFEYGSNPRTADGFASFMKDPKAPPPPPPPEPAWSEVKSNVVHLTDSNWNSYLKRNKKKHVLVMFYAPWCGHCKHMKPGYQEAAAEFAAEKRNDLVLAAVDATKEKETAGQFDIGGYPTLLYFHNGAQSKYEGSREKEGIMTWLRGRGDDKEL